jgi:hypothetical protein
MYSEIDDDGWEVRKVEVFRDGSHGWADCSASTRDTGLGDIAIGGLAEINSQKCFEASRISAEDFENIWTLAVSS